MNEIEFLFLILYIFFLFLLFYVTSFKKFKDL